MRAVVLVGGFGTRLRPLTNDVPKPVLPVGNRPMIELLVRHLGAGGVDEVVLGLGFRPEPFRRVFPDDRCSAVTIRYAVEPEPLDTAGAIAFAAREAGIDETFVVVNGDVMTEVDLAAMVAFHRERGAEGTLHLIGVDDPSAFGVVDTDPDGRVRAFVEKPAPGTEPSNLVNAGSYVLEPSVVDRIPAGRRVSIERETFPAMVADGSLYAFAQDCYWLDTGRPELYLQANLDIVDGRRPAVAGVTTAVDPGAAVDPAATVSRAVVGAGCRVAAGAMVDESVLLPGAVVGAGATVRRSLVAGRVGDGASVVGSVIGAAGVVAAGAALEGARVPPVA
jgi:mannose-1-phosphate guanylyltransferase